MQLWKTSKLGSVVAPPSGQASYQPIVDQASGNLSKKLNSAKRFVVFSSNRDGNHDIFKLDLNQFASNSKDRSPLSKLTSHLNTETYPRISPDGRYLVFARAHQAWVSQRNTEAWDVVLLNLSTLEEQIIANNATAPAWASATQVSFSQSSDKVALFDLTTGSTSIVYQTGMNNSMPKSSKIYNPKMNLISKELAFTARQSDIKMNKGSWGTAIALGQTHRGIHNGCELNWSADGRTIFQVHPRTGVNDSNRIVSVDENTLELKTLIDLQGEFSHEYWPQQSSNGQFMVFGASRSRKEHEHDVADYEIFLWEVGSPSNDAARLTFHTGNDNWPDVFIEQ